MAATMQQQRPQEQKTGSWSAVFPNEQITSQQSSLFVKKLLAVAVSNIAYLRAIFPEHAFGDRCLEDLNLKVLRDNSTCPGACQIIRWIRGCFDALDKQYLKTIIIGIYVDAENPDTVIESYTFKFSYTGNNTGVDVYSNDKHLIGEHGGEETKKATMRLLRTIVVLTQSLKSLPDDVMMTMKLLYNDDVTPADYEPPGFMPAKASNFTFEDEAMNIKVGDVSTPFHMVKMRIKTDKKQFSTDVDAPRESTSTNLDSADEHESSDQLMAEDPGEQPTEAGDVPNVTPSKPDAAVMDIPDPEGVSSTTENTNGVRCACGYNEDDGMMILCAVCNMWQHAVCFSIVDMECAPQRHICNLCANPQVSDLQPTDSLLLGLTDVAIQAQCLWRRTILVCSESESIMQKSLSSKLGVDITVARGLVARLEKEGFIKSDKKGKRFRKLVQKQKVIDEALPKYLQLPESTELTAKLALSNNNNDVTIAETKDNVTEKEIDKIASMTEDIKLSVCKGKRNNKGKLVTPKEGKVKKARRGDHEFDVSNSQEMSQEIDYGTRRKRIKASIVTRPVMV